MKWFATLRWRVLALALLTSLPIAAVGVKHAVDERSRHLADACEEATRVAALAARQQATLVDNSRLVLQALALVPALQQPESPECGRVLAEAITLDSRFDNLVVIRADGAITCSARPGPATGPRPLDAWARRALTERRFAVGEYQVGQSSGTAGLRLAAPLPARASGPAGFLGATIDLAWLSRFTEHASLPPDSTVTVLDRKGIVLARRPDPTRWIGKAAVTGAYQAALKGAGTEWLTDPDGVERLYAFTPVRIGSDTAFHIAVGIPKSTIVASANAELGVHIAAFTLAVLVSFAGVWLGGAVIFLKPLRRLAASTRALAAGNLATRSGVADLQNEFGHLGRAFDEMAETLQARASARAQAEAALRLANEELERIVLASPLPIIGLALDGTVTVWNPAAERLLGWSREDVLGRQIPNVPAHAMPAFAQAVQGGERLQGAERQVVRRDGTAVDIQVYAAPLHDGNGCVRGMVAVVNDVTEAKRLDNALALARDFYLKLFDNLPAMIWRSRPDSRADYFSRSWFAFTGRTPEQELGTGWMDGVHPDDRDDCLRAYVEAFEARRPYDAEYRLRRHDGQYRLVADAGHPFDDLDGHFAGYVGLCQDITERKLMEDRVRAAQKMQAVGQLAGGVAHDFNNLLTAIIGYNQLVARRLPDKSAERGFTHEVQQAATHAAKLVRQLLAFGRRQILRPRVCALNGIVASQQTLLRGLLGERVRVSTSCSPEPLHVNVDVGQLEQVLVDLALSARGTMPDGGTFSIQTAAATVTLADAIASHEVEPGDYALAVIRYSAHLTEEAQARLFEPFYTTRELWHGSGLGLSTVYGVIKQSGGHITVESSPEAGTSFRIYLPGVAAPAAAPVVAEPSRQARGPLTILLVEDEEHVLALARTVLQAEGHTVLDALNGHEAFQIAERFAGRIDVLVADVVMPDMSGPEVARALRAARPEIVTVLVSGYAETTVLPEEVTAGDAIFVPKPYTPEALLEKISAALDRGAPRDV
jgi:PAS domain S-box-containing protein